MYHLAFTDFENDLLAQRYQRALDSGDDEAFTALCMPEVKPVHAKAISAYSFCELVDERDGDSGPLAEFATDQPQESQYHVSFTRAGLQVEQVEQVAAAPGVKQHSPPPQQTPVVHGGTDHSLPAPVATDGAGERVGAQVASLFEGMVVEAPPHAPKQSAELDARVALFQVVQEAVCVCVCVCVCLSDTDDDEIGGVVPSLQVGVAAPPCGLGHSFDYIMSLSMLLAICGVAGAASATGSVVQGLVVHRGWWCIGAHRSTFFLVAVILLLAASTTASITTSRATRAATTVMPFNFEVASGFTIEISSAYFVL